jgi:16S rRNA (cytosine1402-N4)-methyltransferase
MICKLDEVALSEILLQNSDEPNAVSIARAICSQAKNIDTTTKLATLVKETMMQRYRSVQDSDIKKTQQRVFQALRIAVNDEFGVLKQFLNLIPDCLKPGGRIAILTFHSGEDRLVKKSFQAGYRSGIYQSIATEPLRPGAEEKRANPRSSCAKLRWAVKS